MSTRAGLIATAVVCSAAAVACQGVIGEGQPTSRASASGNSGAASGGQTPNAPADGDLGFKGIHRLNNTEYDRTVAHLLGTALTPASAFTIEEEAAGFNTVAEGLTMSPRQVADYFAAAFELAADVFAKPELAARIVSCEPAAPGDGACAEMIIQSFGLRAFRRPLDPGEVADLLGRYQAALALGDDHRGALQQVVATMLASPQFLYRIEFDPDPASTAVHPLSAHELASRLSYLIWSSMPDDELFELAGSGALLEIETLSAQVERMLADAKSSMLIDSFAAQWLGARHLDLHEADPALFPAWNAELRLSMQQEMGAYFDEFLHGGRPYSEFLSADVNFVDPRLASVYGMAAPSAAGLVRVENTADQRRGYLGLAGFLTYTSRKDRTAPSIRAKWVLDGLWCTVLEPPDDVIVAELPPPAENQTVRDVLAVHRTNPACAPCHDTMDPVGLGLENFDAIGAYRDFYLNGLPVDASGQMPGGETFSGFSDLVTLVADSEQFLPCAAQKLFVYGLGRSIGPSKSYVDQVVENWKKTGLGLNELLEQLVLNDVFRYRRGDAG
jgi:hypothetical protein